MSSKKKVENENDDKKLRPTKRFIFKNNVLHKNAFGENNSGKNDCPGWRREYNQPKRIRYEQTQ